MTRNLRVLITAAMALTAFGALSVTAHAAEEKFHCSVEPCRVTLGPDEVAGTTTAHHVFVIKGKSASGSEVSASFTCNQLTGEATASTKTSTELTFTNLKVENSTGEQKCKVGAAETVQSNFTSCDYRFISTGGGTASGSQFHLLCATAGDGIDLTVNGTICLQITPFTATGIGYHDSGIGGAKKIVTATTSMVIPAAALDLKNVGNFQCSALGMTSITSASYTTGNTVIKAETDPGGVTAEAWFE